MRSATRSCDRERVGCLLGFKLQAPLQTVIEGEYGSGPLRRLKVTRQLRRAEVVDLGRVWRSGPNRQEN